MTLGKEYAILRCEKCNGQEHEVLHQPAYYAGGASFNGPEHMRAKCLVCGYSREFTMGRIFQLDVMPAEATLGWEWQSPGRNTWFVITEPGINLRDILSKVSGLFAFYYFG